MTNTLIEQSFALTAVTKNTTITSRSAAFLPVSTLCCSLSSWKHFSLISTHYISLMCLHSRLKAARGRHLLWDGQWWKYVPKNILDYRVSSLFCAVRLLYHSWMVSNGCNNKVKQFKQMNFNQLLIYKLFFVSGGKHLFLLWRWMF